MSSRVPSASSAAALETSVGAGLSREGHSCARCDGTGGDPLAATFRLGRETEGVLPWLGYFAAATALQVLLAYGSVAFGLHFHPPATAELRTTSLEIDIAKDEPPPPPPAPPAEEPAPTPVAPVARVAPVKEAPPPAAAAAKASAVLAQAPDPNEPLDLTGNTIITGNSDQFGGGTTMSNGTGEGVHARVVAPVAIAPAPKAAPVAAAPAPPRVNKSRGIQNFSGKQWDCPWPSEAEVDTDHRDVLITVTVDAEGELKSVATLKNGDHGFAGAAERCARRQKFGAAWDEDGNPISTTMKFNIKFER